MKIAKYGTVTIPTEGDIRIEGFLAEPEIDDPREATLEQLLTTCVVEWAAEKLAKADLGEMPVTALVMIKKGTVTLTEHQIKVEGFEAIPEDAPGVYAWAIASAYEKFSKAAGREMLRAMKRTSERLLQN